MTPFTYCITDCRKSRRGRVSLPSSLYATASACGERGTTVSRGPDCWFDHAAAAKASDDVAREISAVLDLQKVVIRHPDIRMGFARGTNVKKFLVTALCLAFSSCVSACPKLLYMSVNYDRENNLVDAQYWGKTVGVQGVFINYLMTYWTTNVGATPNALWQSAKSFQEIYAKYGVTDNFVKVSIYNNLNWNDQNVVNQYVTDFGNLAKLARYAGFKGIALDLEPYNSAWGGVAGGNQQTVQRAAKLIGQAMHQAYPDMTLMILPDVVYEYNATKDLSLRTGGYALAIPFVSGLFQQPWKQVVMATEGTYRASPPSIVHWVNLTYSNYDGMFAPGQFPFSVAPGIWPLGVSSTDKSAVMSVSQFQQNLATDYAEADSYVWIFGMGNAWQTDKYGSVVPNFYQYTNVVKSACTL